MRRPVLMLLLLTACSASTQSGDPAQTTNVKTTVAPRETLDLSRETVAKQADFTAPRRRVWDALLAAHEAVGIPYVRGDVDSGHAVFALTNRLRTIGTKPADRYIDCGNGPAGPRTDSYRLTLKVTHRLESVSLNTTRLTTSVQAWARNPGISSDAIPCHSLGVLEQEIGGIVAVRVR